MMPTPYRSFNSIAPREILEFEQTWGLRRFGTAKAVAIRTRFGIPPTSYYQGLNRLLDSDIVASAYPELVAELLERRTTRHERRRGRDVAL